MVIGLLNGNNLLYYKHMLFLFWGRYSLFGTYYPEPQLPVESPADKKYLAYGGGGQVARKELWSWLKTLALAVVLALLIREYVFAFYVVDGISMLPTLKDGEMVAVSKLAYRFGSLKRGDVAVFEANKTQVGSLRERVLIKRIVAIPGDIIEIRGGRVYLNGEELIEPYVEALSQKDLEPLLVGDDLVFVIGDNRHPNGSWDSREFGPIPIKSLVGKAILVIFPVPHKMK